MLSFNGGLKVFIALEPCDLRKSFNGLQALVSERLGEDPRQGALFVFTNLGPKASIKLRLAPEALATLTDGIELRGARMRPWYEREWFTARNSVQSSCHDLKSRSL